MCLIPESHLDLALEDEDGTVSQSLTRQLRRLSMAHTLTVAIIYIPIFGL